MSLQPAAVGAIWTLGVDSVTAEVGHAFDGEGIACLLLKGPSVAAWLYDDPTDRPYGDTDLLVAPASAPAARKVLGGLGFTRAFGPVPHTGMEEPPSSPWHRDPFVVDLHEAVSGILGDPDAVFRRLWVDSTAQVVGGRKMRVLCEPARLVLVALHAAHHGPHVAAPLRDVGRAVRTRSLEEWELAADSARQMDALEAFALGISLDPDGADLLARLRLEAWPSVAWLLESENVPLAAGIERLSRARGPVAATRMLWDEALPSAEFMRWWTPLARRSRRGLAASYLLRVSVLARNSLPAIVAWRKAKRQTRSVR